MSRAKTWPLVLPRQLSKHSNFVPGLLELHTARKSPRRAPGDMRGHGLRSRACPQLPFGPSQPAVMSASLFPSGSLSSLLSQSGAGPSSACGPGDWEVGWSHSDAGSNQSHSGGVYTQDNTSLHRESWVKGVYKTPFPMNRNSKCNPEAFRKRGRDVNGIPPLGTCVHSAVGFCADHYSPHLLLSVCISFLGSS